MMGTRRPCLSSSSTMRGTAAAASSLLTVTRTSSEPARARAAHCWTVEGISAVSVLVMDCTTIGASEPTRTPPTTAVTVFLRGIIAMGASILTRGNRASRSLLLPELDSGLLGCRRLHDTASLPDQFDQFCSFSFFNILCEADRLGSVVEGDPTRSAAPTCAHLRLKAQVAHVTD